MFKHDEIYIYFSELIQSGQLMQGERLPSVRKAANLFSVSRTTIQNAYFNLQADGYIIAQEKSGYYVTDFKADSSSTVSDETQRSAIRYDLKSGSADSNSFDIALWQRYIKSALRQKERLLSYSDAQGEADLREALSDYIRTKRNVIASAERIVVASGIQPLLLILGMLLPDKKTASFPDESFTQGRHLFSRFGYEVKTRYKDADIIYVSPSHMTSYGDVMPMKRRLELVHYSDARGSLIIEDDYDADFLYNKKPTPALFALSGGGNVVYMGSFSNVLIPGIRISFMVLTKALAERYRTQKAYFTQTASKTEQIALCQYIRDGHIYAQTRKIRRLYTAKASCLLNAINAKMVGAEAHISENGLQVKLAVPYRGDTDAFLKAGIAVDIKEYKDNILKLVLSPSSVPMEDMAIIVEKLNKIIKK